MNKLQRREWRADVLGHSELTPAQKVALLGLETYADYPEGTNARPGVAALADLCGLKIRAVESALAQGRHLKLIEQTDRANPKRGLAAVYRLVSTRTTVRTEADSTRADVRTESGFNPHETTFQPARNGVSTRTLVQPTKGDHQDRSPRGRADEPRCARHRHTHRPPPCPDCEQIRKEREGAAESEQAAIRKAIDDCPDCDQYGRHVINPAVDCPKHPNFLARSRSTA